MVVVVVVVVSFAIVANVIFVSRPAGQTQKKLSAQAKAKSRQVDLELRRCFRHSLFRTPSPSAALTMLVVFVFVVHFVVRGGPRKVKFSIFF